LGGRRECASGTAGAGEFTFWLRTFSYKSGGEPPPLQIFVRHRDCATWAPAFGGCFAPTQDKNGVLQGLKPKLDPATLMSELKLRPPEENANPSAGPPHSLQRGSGREGDVKGGLVLLGAGVVEKRSGLPVGDSPVP